MALISASKLQRIAACPASAVLPQVESDSEAADRGTEIHGYLAALVEGLDADAALARVPKEHRQDCLNIDPTEVPRGATEIAFAYNVATGTARVIGQNIGRDYGKLSDNEIPGSADVVANLGASVFIADWKTGHSAVTPARENLQLRFLALAACRVYGLSAATVAILYVRPDGTITRDTAELDAFDLEAVAVELRQLHARVAAAAAAQVPNVREGSHCRYCSAFQACPAKTQMLVRLTVPQGVEQRFSALLTPAHAAEAYELVRNAQDMIKKLWAQLFKWAEENPIQLPNGKVFGPHVTEREELSGPVVREVLRELHGDAVAEAAVELSATKSSLEAALRIVAGRGQLAAMKREAMKAIEARDGLRVKTTSKTEEHHP